MSLRTVLLIDDLDTRHRGLTAAVAASYREAAIVCLHRHHASPTELLLRARSGETRAELTWVPPDRRVLDAWNNTIDATEAGAYACVIAAAELREGLYAVRRAEHSSGADYYVGPLGAGAEDLEDCYRLEVGGTDESSDAAIERLLRTKIEQTRRGRGSLPAFAGVIGFRERRILLSDMVDPT